MKKKVLALLLCMSMATGALAGCKGSTGGNSDLQTSASGGTSEQSEKNTGRQNLREMGRKTRLLKIPSPLPLQRILGVCTHMINFRELEGGYGRRYMSLYMSTARKP